LTYFAFKYGYQPSKNSKFSISGARKNFCHMTQQMGHSTAVGVRYYKRADEYQHRIASNIVIFSKSVDTKHVQLSIKQSEITPAFQDPGFFKPNWPQQLAPLPHPPGKAAGMSGR
jgi:hypothetical protein